MRMTINWILNLLNEFLIMTLSIDKKEAILLNSLS